MISFRREKGSKMFFEELLIVAFVVVFANAEVPSYIQVCGAKNPKLDECVINSIQALSQKLKDGIPELDIPSSDPLTIDKVQIADMDNFKAVGSNIRLHGLPSYRINLLHLDLANRTIDIDVQFDEIKLTADYQVNVRILVPIAGHGPITMSTNDVKAKSKLKFKLVNHNGKNYLYFYSMTIRLDVKDYTFNFVAENFDKTLQEAVHEALGNSHQEILEATRPNLEKAISERCLEMANKICKHFTFDELFPDRE
ncbi:protein takeout [Ptiloglossa arizonensis]|uniref:protein takeout n=1 Tax=Ptiloglossa arizonensis TaxID=3350558 RepID=UPI003F9F08C2